MSKKLLNCLIAILAIMFLSGQAMAGGADLFLKKCMGCHSRNGKAAPISPADKSSTVWEKYFKRNRHPVDLSGMITPDEMKSILQTLKDHAADSDQPTAAIIPK